MGLLLSQLLNRAGVETVVLERATRDRVLARIRAWVLEEGTAKMLNLAGFGARMAEQGSPHSECYFTDDDLMVHINFKELSGRQVMVYGQTEVTRDLYDARDAMGAHILHDVSDVAIDGADSDKPRVTFSHAGISKHVACGYIAGCDGFHGASRNSIPAETRRTFERVYPFGWLGILSRTAPAHHELIYANPRNGFALASMRNARLSRYCVQVPLTDRIEDWSDEQFWDRLIACLPQEVATTLETGPSIEKSIAPLRSFVSAPLRWGRLFLVGDAAHIVPPTGAKGLNLAVLDVFYLHAALNDAVRAGDTSGIDAYSDRALSRIWKATRFSWQMTTMLHRFDGEDDFIAQMRKATLRHLAGSETARRELAENDIGLPF